MARIGDLLLGIWFLLVVLAFWGPYLGIPFPSNMGAAIYAVMLLAAITGVALRIVSGRDREKNPDIAPPAKTGDG